MIHDNENKKKLFIELYYKILGSRYLAYSSDVGESFRPIIPPHLVTATYVISWTYVLGDVAYEGYKASEIEKKVTKT